MDKSIQEKLDYYTRLAKRSVGEKPKSSTPAKPDSLSTVIRTKEDAVLFMAQLDALTELAHQEYAESKRKEQNSSQS